MENLLSILIGGGIFAFGSLWVLYVITQKFPSLKAKSFFKWLNEALMFAVLACIAGVVILFLWDWLSQPSGMEKCMEGTQGMTDGEAIAWMEDYCAQRNY
jgi:hypothetical protein